MNVKNSMLPLNLVYLSAQDSMDFCSQSAIYPYAQIGFGSHQQEKTKWPSATVPMPPLGQYNQELWFSTKPLIYNEIDSISYAYNEEIIFGILEQTDTFSSSFGQLTEDNYDKLQQFIQSQGYRNLLRVWNYFSGINKEENSLERYQHFCVGRHQALTKSSALNVLSLPSASALGTLGDYNAIFFIAIKEAGQPIENPRQTQAYYYPKQYSPLSPTFARAMYKTWPPGVQLYISGTASIVGHKSLHIGSVKQQTEEALNNIDILIKHSENKADQPFSIAKYSEILTLKVYVRYPDDYLSVKENIERRYGKEVQVIYLQADICREELLVEIEGMISVNKIID